MKQDEDLRPLIERQLMGAETKDSSWSFGFDDEAKVVTESPWRAIDDQRIVVISEDDDQKFGLPAPVDAASVL